jgi:two-component system response regulator
MGDDLSEAQTILIVDDNEEDYQSADRAFKKANLRNQTVWCKSGQEALDYLKHEKDFKEVKSAPGLILLDLNMPGTAGQETLRIVKSDKDLQYIPVIVLTSSDNKRDIMSAFLAGANSYVRKPVTFEKMIKAIKVLNDYWFEISLLPKEN